MDIKELKASKPNIILIVSDDHGYADLSFTHAKEDVHTPNLDRLRKSGMLLEQGYVSAPVCSPSRSGMIVGSYQQRWGGHYFGDINFAPDSMETIPELLKKAGYTTGYFGKVHYGNDKPGSRACPDMHGFDESFYGLAALGYGRLHYLNHEFNADEKYGQSALVHNMYPLYENGKPVECKNFLTYEFANRAMNFMDKHKDDENPYFYMLAFNAVHNFTWQLPDEELEKRGLPKFEDFDENKLEYVDWYDGVIMPNLPNGRQYYLAQLELMDKKIGEILDKVEELGQEENTLIIYITDNGGSPCNYGDNTPLRGTKYTLYEGGIRVPFLASWKGVISKNSTSRNLSSSLDFMTTFAYLAGVEVSSTNYEDGVNLLPTFLGQKGGHDNLYFDTGFQSSIRDERWKLLMSDLEESENAKNSLEKIEHASFSLGRFLYDIENDLDESDEKSKLNENKEIAKNLENKFDEWKKEVEDSEF